METKGDHILVCANKEEVIARRQVKGSLFEGWTMVDLENAATVVGRRVAQYVITESAAESPHLRWAVANLNRSLLLGMARSRRAC
ncbi:hypothetical protein C8K36_102465 [Rhodococcus sp. OK519]|nr:hypothetical protein C8K36_102465 [Rhodococcus sp. OK519]